MATRGEIKADDFRIIFKSPVFPTSSFAYAHDLHPDLVKTLTKCFYDFRFPEEMKKTFGGADRFFPITYQKDWEVVRKIAEGTGTPFNRTAYEKESAREAAARKKAADEKAKKK
jgi:phosphonate transport system substrate-binding protein